MGDREAFDESELAVDAKATAGPEENWTGFILRYDRERQGRLFGNLARSVGSGAAGLLAVIGAFFAALPWPVLAVAFLAVAGGSAWFVVRSRKRREIARVFGGKPPRKQARSLTFYAEFLKAMRRLGYARVPSQTPAEFAAAVLKRDRTFEDVLPVTDMFHRIRYAEDIPPRRDLMKIFSIVKRLKERTRGRGKRDPAQP
jgi:hypothetical protein